LAGVVALVGLQFQQTIDTQQGYIIGGVLVLTGGILLFLELLGAARFVQHGGDGHTHSYEMEHHTHNDHDHSHSANGSHGHNHSHSTLSTVQPSLLRRVAALAVPFGVAASPDLTILPVALGASALGGGAIILVLIVFALITIATFVLLTVLATLVGYQFKGAWLEKYATTISAVVLIAIGIVAFIGF
jgi:ABC-type nickel/cobalt efflux system permease component RcnA